MEKCYKERISVLTFTDPFYPERVKEPKDAPVILYYKGTLRELSKTVGIVGARRCAQDDKEKVIELVKQQTCYPSEHRQLMKRIEETGLLLSEYPPGTASSRYNFPKRNRIISAWSDRLIVVASGKKKRCPDNGRVCEKIWTGCGRMICKVICKFVYKNFCVGIMELRK